MKPLISNILLLALFLSSCSKSPKCWGEDENHGIIETSLQIHCEPYSENSDFLILSDSAYKAIFTHPNNGELCTTLPYVDFNIHTVLGIYATGQCEVKYIREVRRFDAERKYQYVVVVKSCGTCKRQGYSYNWVLVPRLPEGWSVTFEWREE